MKTRIALILSTLFLIVTVLACDDGGDSKKNMTPDEYMDYLGDQYFESFCNYLIRCPGAGGSLQFQNAAECRTIMRAILFPQMNAEMMWAMENGAQPNPDKLDECLDAPASCDAELSAIAACRQIFIGTIANGQPCSVNWQCVSGFCDTSDICPGVCAATKAAGADCETDEECSPGLICNDEDKCGQLAPADQGDACDDDGQCKYGLYCLINDFQNYTGTCQPWLEENDTCIENDNELTCGPGLGCNHETSTCEKITVVGQGQACDGEVVICNLSQHLFCVQDSCMKIPGNGEACPEGYCWPGNYCGDDNICHTAKAYGETCTTDEECQTELCDPQTHMCTYEPCDTGVDY